MEGVLVSGMNKEMLMTDPPSRKDLPPIFWECGQQTALGWQPIQGLPQLQRAAWSKVTPFPMWLTSSDRSILAQCSATLKDYFSSGPPCGVN